MTNTHKTVIAGSRSITDYEVVCEAIDSAPFNISTVVSGKAVGVDTLGEKWAENNGLPIEEYPFEDYKDENDPRPAPLIRNQAMATNSDALIAVWDGSSSGTENMITEAKKNDLRIHVFRVDTSSLTDFI